MKLNYILSNSTIKFYLNFFIKYFFLINSFIPLCYVVSIFPVEFIRGDRNI